MEYKLGLFISLCFIFSTFAWGQPPMFDPPLSPRIANYDIEVELDAEGKKLYGKEVLVWNNPSQDTIRELRFHLYLNAFRNAQSTFMQGRGRIDNTVSERDLEACIWGGIDVNKIQVLGGIDLTEAMQIIAPDDGNTEDRTVLLVPLKEPVLPRSSLSLEIDFTAKIPEIMARTGYNGDYYFMAQWFPKIGVYEAKGVRGAEEGRWNCHQYHRTGEYYANFGVYNVAITTPTNYVVGASGTLYKEEDKGEKKVHHFYLEDVIDFTWAASPHFTIYEDRWSNVNIRILTYPGRDCFVERYVEVVKNGLEYLNEHIGKYPYHTFTVIDPPINGLRSGGMEYPTLMSGANFYGFPKGITIMETLTVHELVHQYFMQMVATNETEDPWMDEGMTTYLEGRIMDHYYGDRTAAVDILGIKVGNEEYGRFIYTSMANPKIAPGDLHSWEYIHGGYSNIVYDKTAVWLRTLEGLVGIQTMDEILQTFFERWKFKHPGAQDFIDIVNEVVTKNHKDQFGENMDWFFEQVLYGTEVCDYKLASISNNQRTRRLGVFDDLEECITPSNIQNQDSTQAKYQSSVIVHRLGEIKLPIEVLIHFENGEEVKKLWDGKDRSTEFTFTSDHKIDWAIVDPEKKIDLDMNFNNNSLRIKPVKTGIRKYFYNVLTWVQNLMQSMSVLV